MSSVKKNNLFGIGFSSTMVENLVENPKEIFLRVSESARKIFRFEAPSYDDAIILNRVISYLPNAFFSVSTIKFLFQTYIIRKASPEALDNQVKTEIARAVILGFLIAPSFVDLVTLDLTATTVRLLYDNYNRNIPITGNMNILFNKIIDISTFFFKKF